MRELHLYCSPRRALAVAAVAACAACAPSAPAATPSLPVPDRAGASGPSSPAPAPAEAAPGPSPNLETGGGDCGGAALGGVINGVFSAPDTGSSFTVPAAPGQGVMRMTFSVDEAIEAKIIMRPIPRKMHSSRNPPNKTITHLWYARGGVPFPYELGQVGLAAPEVYPVNWRAEWSWTPSGDCTEPNQTHAQATPLELGEQVKGFMRAGYHPGYHFHDMTDVWRFELPEDGMIHARLESAPGDVGYDLSIFTDQNLKVSHHNPGGPARTHPLPAGTYYLHVAVPGMPRTPVHKKGQGGAHDDPRPEHIFEPYVLVVEREDPPEPSSP